MSEVFYTILVHGAQCLGPALEIREQGTIMGVILTVATGDKYGIIGAAVGI